MFESNAYDLDHTDFQICPILPIHHANNGGSVTTCEHVDRTIRNTELEALMAADVVQLRMNDHANMRGCRKGHLINRIKQRLVFTIRVFRYVKHFRAIFRGDRNVSRNWYDPANKDVA